MNKFNLVVRAADGAVETFKSPIAASTSEGWLCPAQVHSADLSERRRLSHGSRWDFPGVACNDGKVWAA